MANGNNAPSPCELPENRKLFDRLLSGGAYLDIIMKACAAICFNCQDSRTCDYCVKRGEPLPEPYYKYAEYTSVGDMIRENLLTPHQKEILEMHNSGWSDAEINATLNITGAGKVLSQIKDLLKITLAITDMRSLIDFMRNTEISPRTKNTIFLKTITDQELRQLDERTREILSLYMGGKTLKAIALRYGVSKQAIDKTINKTIERIVDARDKELRTT